MAQFLILIGFPAAVLSSAIAITIRANKKTTRDHRKFVARHINNK